MQIETLTSPMVERLKEVRGVRAIVLGGSYATGTQRPDSDIDLALYYGDEGLDTEAIRLLAAEVNDTPNPVVTDRGGWGTWVNGGAWLTIRGQRLDLLYRDTAFVTRILDDCLSGRKEWDYAQQPPYGFFSYTYCAETQACKILYDPEGIIANLKTRVETYPRALGDSILRDAMWSAEFSLIQCKKAAARGQGFIAAGCLTRIASHLVQTLYALNDTYFMSEKRFYAQEAAFTIQPRAFRSRLESLLGRMGETPSELQASTAEASALIDEMKALCGERYSPRFG